MRRRLAVLSICLCVSAGWSGAGSAQDDSQATIEALETRVAELEATIAGGTPESDSGNVLTDPLDALFGADSPSPLFGSFPGDLPTAEAGTVQVVLTGSPVRSSVPVVIHNASGGDVVISEVYGTGRSADGSLAASAEVSTIVPFRIADGEYGVGSVYFGASDLPPGLSLEYEVDWSSAEDDSGYFVDVPIVEAEALPDDILGGIIGRIANDRDVDLSGPFSVQGACFDASGNLNGYFAAYAAKNELAPGEESTFDAEHYGNQSGFSADTCAHWVIGARGYAGF